MAGMLPPFVPPSARATSETLPSITEFVVDRVDQSDRGERSFENSFSVEGNAESGGIATLPSIDEFVHHAPESATRTETDEDEFIQRTSRSPWGTYEAESVVSGASAAPAVVPENLEPDLMPIERRTPPSGSEDAIVNEIAEPPDAWAASAAGRSGVDESEPQAPSEPAPSAEPTGAPTQLPAEVWVDEERDAFDWHGVASLAVPPAEEQRAAEEWSTTEWERSSGSVQDHVASLVAQIARRVRSGELEVQGSKHMGPEAALVAVLSALLAEPGRT